MGSEKECHVAIYGRQDNKDRRYRLASSTELTAEQMQTLLQIYPNVAISHIMSMSKEQLMKIYPEAFAKATIPEEAPIYVSQDELIAAK